MFKKGSQTDLIGYEMKCVRSVLVQTNDENDREPDPPHRHLVSGLAGGSLAEDGESQESATLVEHGLFDHLVRPPQQ